MRLLVTGANGFIGTQLCARLAGRDGHGVIAVTRRAVNWPLSVPLTCQSGDWCKADWRPLLQGVDVVMHLAGKAHSAGAASAQLLDEYRRINVEATRRIARQAVEAGVRRLVFVSSIKVNGEVTPADRPYRSVDEPQPVDAYGISKWEAEQVLREVAQETGLEVTIVRPPLVYGPEAKGNFSLLIRAVQAGVPLPFGAVQNLRSLVGVDNLVDLLAACAVHPQAAGRTFLVSDGDDLSTADLIRRIAKASARSSRLYPLPTAVLRLAACLTGHTAAMDRLTGSLRVDIQETRTVLGWSPPCSVELGLRRALAQKGSMDAKKMRGNSSVIRFLDIALAGFGLLVLMPVFAILLVLGLFDTGSPLFRQVRLGRDQKPFVLVKFRTMRKDTASLASHLVNASAVTAYGRFLRHSKLDELPQLWNVLKGEMSLVGPRPGLANQEELTRERAALDVFAVRPGVTGLAQVQGIDMSQPRRLAEVDRQMISTLGGGDYFRYILQTVMGKGAGDRVVPPRR